MARGVIDVEGMDAPDIRALRDAKTPDGLPFSINKIGHVVLMVQDLERSVKFYTEVLGFRVSDVYPPSMVPGRMVFMRCANDHHGVALVTRKKMALHLDGATIDFKDGPTGRGFAVENPNAPASGGCPGCGGH